MKNIALCLRYDGSRYHGGEGRTRMKKLSFALRDFVALILGVGVLALMIALKKLGI